MTLSRPRLSLTGAVWAALILAPALCSAQPPGDIGPKGGSNLTRQTQNEVDIALPSLAPLVERVMPAVVNISVELKEQAAKQGDEGTGDESASPLGPSGTPFDQFLKRFFEQPFQSRNPAEKVMALGSGFIIDPAGYIVTNNHVVANADKVTVIFQDNTRHTAKVIGRDEKTDIALLKIDSNQKLPYVTWGNSDDAKVGDWMVAVGNPFGLGGSVTAGIISALGRNINEGPYDDFLQIDAPINRGNSGGPTFNLHGQVIGINTAIYSPSGGSVGIGFAVPSNIVEHVVVQLKEHGHVTWGWLGVAIQNVTPAIAKSLGLDPDQPTGALVASVTADSPAARAGIKQGDVITAAGGHEIKSVHDLPRLVAATPVGTKLELTIVRDGKQKTVEASIGEMPTNVASAEPEAAQPGGGKAANALGMELLPLDPQLRKELKVPKDLNGVVVGQVASGSPAGDLGIQPGDVIVSVDQKPVTAPENAAAQLKEAAALGNVLLLLNRHGRSEFVGLSIENNGTAGSSR
ncbi:MAG: DegQ family serine endoprotease [Stellaceae bacterium]